MFFTKVSIAERCRFWG